MAGSRRPGSHLPDSRNNPRSALELLGTKYGLFTDRVQFDGNALVQIVDDIPEGDIDPAE